MPSNSNEWALWLLLAIFVIFLEHGGMWFLHEAKKRVKKWLDDLRFKEPLSRGSYERAKSQRDKWDVELTGLRQYKNNGVALSAYLAGETLRMLTHMAIAGILVALATATSLTSVPLGDAEFGRSNLQSVFQTITSLLAALIFLRAVIFGWVACQQRDNVIEFTGNEKKLDDKIKDLERKIENYETQHAEPQPSAPSPQANS